MARDSSERKFRRFSQMLRAQAELYRTLIGLVKKQGQEVAHRNIDGFLQVLEEKRTVLQEIESLELSCIPLRDLWEQENHQASKQVRTNLREIVEEIRGLLEDLLEMELNCQQELGHAKDLVEEELRQVTVGPDALRSYKGSMQCKPRFMNEIG